MYTCGGTPASLMRMAIHHLLSPILSSAPTLIEVESGCTVHTLHRPAIQSFSLLLLWVQLALLPLPHYPPAAAAAARPSNECLGVFNQAGCTTTTNRAIANDPETADIQSVPKFMVLDLSRQFCT